MNISSFDDFLTAARAQSRPQRLLFVFAGVELPADSTDEERERFELGQGGAFVPQMCVDKSPQELVDFAELASEASRFGPPWGMVFAAALEGRPGRVPTSEEAGQALEQMVEAIRQGRLDPFIPFDPQGHAVQIG